MQWIARVSRAYIAIALIGLFSFVLCFSYLRSLDKTVEIARLTKSVNAGKQITLSDIDFVAVPSDEVISNQLILENNFTVNKLIAKVDLAKSDLLTKSNTSKTDLPNKYQSLSIGIEMHRANGGNISKGDAIDVWETGEDAKLITSNVLVREVILPDKRLGVNTTQIMTIVIAVTTDQARALSRVIGEDNIMIVLSNGIQSEDELSNQTGSEEDQAFTPSDLSGTEN